jgi:hypothetical protein
LCKSEVIKVLRIQWRNELLEKITRDAKGITYNRSIRLFRLGVGWVREPQWVVSVREEEKEVR